MPAFHPRIRALTVGVSAIALVAIGVGGTVAASNPATLYACYDVNGNVRMSDSAICKLPGGGRLASWGTTGVPGPTGLAGATGPTGATGATGPAGGVSGYEIVTSASTFVGSSGLGITGVGCPVGKKAVGGGGLITFAGSPVVTAGATITSSAPSLDGTAWSVFFSYSISGLGVESRVVCAVVAP